MKIVSIKRLALHEIVVVRFARFQDGRGWFTEPFRKSDVSASPELAAIATNEFVQVNESHSRPGVVRGLHFQWNPFMGKLVRTVFGRMVDIVLDIRKGSPHFGKGLLYEMPESAGDADGEWIWVPPGFAHGNFFTCETRIEYFCTGEYSPPHEAGIQPWSGDIDWSLADDRILREFKALEGNGALLSEKDANGLSLAAWAADPRSDQVIYGQC